jgi:teichuronic acid biosynthesis glycosyltransferase TuaG
VKKQNEIISIILPVYNGADYLKKSINSILNQTYQDFIIYICNDASTDNSIDIIKKIKSNKIKLFNNKKNIGLSRTRKKIIRYTKGNYIAFIDQDDIWNKKNWKYK